jgi:hypothetical protein
MFGEGTTLTAKWACWLAFSLTPFGTAEAQQQPSSLHEGQRIRITAPVRGLTQITGTFVAIRSDTLLMASVDRQLEVPLSTVTRLEVSRGRSSNAGKGALIGLVGGLVVGGVINYVACNAATSPRTCFESQEGTQYIFLGLWGASGAVGALVGALVGANVHRDRWESLPLEQLSLDTGSLRRRPVALKLSLRFQ